MELDQGEIVGGFAHRYDARIVPHAGTAIVHAIEAATGIDPDDVVQVEVTTDDGEVWERGFSGRWTGSTPCIFTTPNPHVIGIRIRGVAYAVDVRHPDEVSELPALPLTCAVSDILGGRMFLANETRVCAFDGADILWTSERVSLDGICGLKYSNGVVRGMAWVPKRGSDWRLGPNTPFEINATTGDAKGGIIGWFRPV